MNKGEIVIYQTEDGQTQLDVRLEKDTIWMTQMQISELFGTQRPAITKHLSNIFKTGELDENSVSSILEHTASDGKKYGTRFYNLDAILSVGYRVNSKNATQFRIWANRILKEYLIKGFAINPNIQAGQLEDIKNAIQLVSNVLQAQSLSGDEAAGLLKVITNFTYALDTLDRYDYQQLEISDTTLGDGFRATYEGAAQAISLLRDKFASSTLFGNEKDGSFQSSINTIYQTFDGKELYPSVEEKAAMLLYLVTKNHSFSDGNKRIAAFLFLWFLENNRILYKADGTPLVENNTLVAITLMIAESRPEEMEAMIKVIVNLINKHN